MSEPFVLVAAISKNLGIGKEGTLPWKLPKELAYFRKVTSAGTQQNTLIMGKNTWLSLPKRPLPNRKNIVVSSTLEQTEGFQVCRSLREALNYSVGIPFIIGGYSLYKEALSPPCVSGCGQVYLTRIHSDFECDVFFPIGEEELVPGFYKQFESEIFSEESLNYHYEVYQNSELPQKPLLINFQELS